MSRLEIVGSGILYRNPLPGHQVVNAYLPFVLELPDQQWICVYRRATAFYAPDGALALLRSAKGGNTWQEDGLIRDPKADEQRYSYSAPYLTRLHDGSLVLAAFRIAFSDPPRLMVNPQTGGFLPVEHVLFRSVDQGHHWQGPEVVQLPPGVIAYLAGPVVELNDGGWLLPFDRGKAYDDPNPVQPAMLALFSSDQGRTWDDPVWFADGAAQHKAHWHGRVTKLLDGRLFALLWTQDARTGRFVNLHRIVSDVRGREWVLPQPTNLAGETSWAVDLGQGYMVAAYTVRQQQPPGIRATWSEDGGQTWNPSQELVLWDATGRETIGVAAKDSYPVSHDVIAFGRPQAIRAANGDVLVSFWCTEACVTQIQWRRLRLADI